VCIKFKGNKSLIKVVNSGQISCGLLLIAVFYLGPDSKLFLVLRYHCRFTFAAILRLSTEKLKDMSLREMEFYDLADNT
jgi:hypothetical protein